MAGYPKGVFGLCWNLVDAKAVSADDERLFRETEAWFVGNLPGPEPFKNREKVITFFKSGADKMLEKACVLGALLEKYGRPYDVVYTNIVYGNGWHIAVRVDGGRMGWRAISERRYLPMRNLRRRQSAVRPNSTRTVCGGSPLPARMKFPLAAECRCLSR